MAAITEQSALIAAVRLPVVGPGAVTRRVSSWRRWTCHTHFILVNFAGEWPATTVAPTKAGAWMTRTFTSAISVERPLLGPPQHQGHVRAQRRGRRERRSEIRGRRLEVRVAHASRVLVSASRRNELRQHFATRSPIERAREVCDREDALASTRDACATQNAPPPLDSRAASPRERVTFPVLASGRDPSVRHGESVLWRTGSLCSPKNRGARAMMLE